MYVDRREKVQFEVSVWIAFAGKKHAGADSRARVLGSIPKGLLPPHKARGVPVSVDWSKDGCYLQVSTVEHEVLYWSVLQGGGGALLPPYTPALTAPPALLVCLLLWSRARSLSRSRSRSLSFSLSLSLSLSLPPSLPLPCPPSLPSSLTLSESTPLLCC